MGYAQMPREQLGFFPTPIVKLRHLSRNLGGPRIIMKRDDQTGLALGGNKTRKLEYLVGEAMAEGCDTLITGGAEQSNHCRQTAAAAAACGLSCHLVLGGRPPDFPNGNLLLNALFGAELHWTGELRKGEKIPEIAEQIRESGGKPYIIPYGGSNPTGAVGFVEAVRELVTQLAELGETITHIVFPSSSGGTHAGLTVGRSIFDQEFQVVGIGIDKTEAEGGTFDELVLNLSNSTSKRLEAGITFKPSDITVRNEYLGDGYGVVGRLERRAVQLTAETEGILLDPVYTGRAMGALMDMIEQNEFSQKDTVLFWHTGGTPALFPYARQIARG